MMILEYILCFTLILLSVVKTTDLFIQSDNSLNKIEKEFVQNTKSLLKNENGSLTLTAAVLTTMLSALLMFYVSKMKLEYKEAVYRKESYLCFKYLNTETKNYIKAMAFFNWSLRTAFLAKDTVVNGVSGEIIFRALTYARNIRHFAYLKDITQNRFCKIPETLPYLKSPPFKIRTGGVLDSNIDETTIVRQNKWTYSYLKIPLGIRLKKSFCLKAEFQISDAFIPNTKIASKEMAIVALPLLSCFYGSSS
jgi:hypothetical protein